MHQSVNRPSTAETQQAAAPVKAVSAAILHEGRFLLVRRGRAPGRGLYAFPGGRVEDGETLVEAVRREVMEEASAQISAIEHIVDLEIASDDGGRIDFLLSVHAAGFAGGEVVAGDDADAVLWTTVEEMERLPLAHGVLEIARQLALPRQEQNQGSQAGS